MTPADGKKPGKQDEKMDKQLLKPHRHITKAFCNGCTTFINSSVSRHLQQTHDLLAEEIENQVTMYESEKAKLELTEQDKTLQKMYEPLQNGSNAANIRSKIFPPISVLPIVEAFQCTECGELSISKRGATKHSKRCQQSRGGKGKKSDVPKPHHNFHEVLAQRLYGGNKHNYFRVQDKKSPTSTLREKINNLFDARRMEVEKQTFDLENSAKTALLGQLHFDDMHLQYNFTLQKAFQWVQPIETNDYTAVLFSSLLAYISKSHETFMKSAHIKSHNVLGHPLSLDVRDQSERRYCYYLQSLFYMVTRESEEESVVTKHCSQEYKDLVSTLLQRKWYLGNDDESISLFHRFLRNLFLDAPSRSIVPFYISCIAVQKGSGNRGFHYGIGSDISPHLAALWFFIRCFIVQEVYGVGIQSSTLTTGNRSMKERVYDRPAYDAWNKINPYLMKGNDNAITYTRFCLDVCNTIKETELPVLRFLICPKHKLCGILDGHELSLPQLGSKVKDVLRTSRQLMDKHLFLGFLDNIKMDNIMTRSQDFVDDFTNRNYGFSFAEHLQNKEIIEEWRGEFYDYLSKTPEFYKNGSLVKQTANVMVKIGAALKKNLFWLLQMTSGGPARLTELRTLQTENSSTAPRHIFFANGRLFYVLFYHKGMNKLQGVGRPIARFPCEQTSRLLLIYLVFLKPLLYYLEYELKMFPTSPVGGLQVSQAEDLHLFTANGIQWSDSQTYDAFNRIMAKQGIDMNSRQYRQYHGGVVKAFMHGITTEEQQTNLDAEVIIRQTGHSIKVAHNTYGVSEGDMNRLDSITLENFRQTSFNWHKLLYGVSNQEPALPEPPCGNSTTANLQLTVENSEMLRSIESAVVRNLEKQLAPIKEMLASIKDRNSHVLLQKPGLHDERENGCKSRSPEIQRTTTTDALRALKTLTNNRNAEFRGEKQSEAVILACNARDDMLVILPTGWGKSMTYLVPLFLNTQKLSVLVIPLLALQEDTKKRCEDLGISCSYWSDRNTAGARVVLVSVEHLQKRSYKEFLLELNTQNRLFAIYVDEMHLLKQWEGFRSSLKTIHEYLRPEGITVPVIGLSGTCPPVLVNDMKRRLAMQFPRTIRQPTVMGNISYNVMKVQSSISKEISILAAFDTLRNSDLLSLKGGVLRAILYCEKRREVDNLYASCHMHMGTEFVVSRYHAGMDNESRSSMFRNWRTNKPSVKAYIMVATSAFGCGIDVPDVRLVFHTHVPRSIMSFLQESGRAGRDGRLATSVVLKIAESRSSISVDEISKEIDNHRPEEREDTSGLVWSEEWTQRDADMTLYGDITEWMDLDTDECRRWRLEEYNDGISHRKRCFERSIAVCDLCKAVLNNRSTKSNVTLFGASQEKGKTMKSEVTRLEHIVERETSSSFRTTSPPQMYKRPYSAELKTPPSQLNRMLNFSPKIVQETPNNQLTHLHTSDQPFAPPSKRPKSELIDDPVRSPYGYTQTPTDSGVFPSQKPEFVRGKANANTVQSILVDFMGICAPCTVKAGHMVTHTSNDRNQLCYARRCFGCGSERHSYNECYFTGLRGNTPTIKSQHKKPSLCWTCGFANHVGQSLHTENTFGKRTCVLSLCITILVILLESEVGAKNDTARRKYKSLLVAFPELAGCTDVEDLCRRLRVEQAKGYLLVGDVLLWLHTVGFPKEA